MPLLLNDFGHGRNTYPPSKGVPGLPEFEFNNAVGREAKRLLQGKVPTFEAQPFDGLDVPLITRTSLYNAQYAKQKDAIGISDHANANGKTSVRGIGVFYWHTSKEAKKLAEIILDEYKKEFPDRNKYPIWGNGLFPSVPKTWTDLHMCRETHANFVLVEWEFMTNPESLVLLKSSDYRKRCALVKAKAVCRWYEIKFDSSNGSSPSKPTPAPESKPSTGTNAGSSTNNAPQPTGSLGLVDWMKSKGMDSSFNNRAKLASKYGIKNYDGKADQNTKLLGYLQNDNKTTTSKPSQPSKTQPKGDMKTTSIVTYLNSIGVNSSFENRKKLAAANGIKNYTGTTQQNLTLLNKLRGGGTVSTPKATSTPSFKVGGKVKIKSSAKKYATGQNIPNSVKGKSYTIQQIKSDRVLLKEIYSWVKKTDLTN